MLPGTGLDVGCWSESPNPFPTRSLGCDFSPKVFPSHRRRPPDFRPRAILAGSGDRIRTCDLWVMSCRLNSLLGPLSLIYAGKWLLTFRAVSERLIHFELFPRVLFPNLFPNRKSLRLRVSWRAGARWSVSGKHASSFAGRLRAFHRALTMHSAERTTRRSRAIIALQPASGMPSAD